MTDKLKKCEACNDPFEWDGTIVIVGDALYHKDCVTLFPTGYFAMLGDEPLGETENDEGQDAYEILDDEELLEVPE